MQVIYGRIRSVDEKNRLISILIKNKIEYFYLSRTQMKRYNPYLSEGLYVYFRCTDHKKIHHHVTCYDITSFIKMARRTKRKLFVYYDIDTIKEGVVKLLNQDHNRMFLDLEFTMPPYNYNRKNTEKEFIPEVIQYGIYIENKNSELLDCDANLIKPLDKRGLNNRTYSFMHIGPSQMRKAISFREFYQNLKYFMDLYNPVIYVWGKNDMSVLDNGYELHGLKPITKRKDFINLMQVIKNYYSIKDDIGLFKAVEWLEDKKITEEQGHDALDDAYMTMKVFHLFKQQITRNKIKIQKPGKKNNKPID